MPPDGDAKVYRRRIRIETAAPGVVLGALEDSAHHVRVVARFDGPKVTQVRGEDVRLPWATCPGAASGLASLDGTELTTSLRSLRRRFDPRIHCTHFFDLAQLTLAHAAAGHDKRSYQVMVGTAGSTTVASLACDGEPLLEWTIDKGEIVAPEMFKGVGLREGFVRWAEEHLDEDGAEAAFVLRRAASMHVIASMDMDSYAVVAESGLPVGVCFTAQPERRALALRNRGTQRDYSPDGAEMLEGFDEALERAAGAGEGPAVVSGR
jgi:hypothetical protein